MLVKTDLEPLLMRPGEDFRLNGRRAFHLKSIEAYQ